PMLGRARLSGARSPADTSLRAVATHLRARTRSRPHRPGCLLQDQAPGTPGSAMPVRWSYSKYSDKFRAAGMCEIVRELSSRPSRDSPEARTRGPATFGTRVLTLEVR